MIVYVVLEHSQDGPSEVRKVFYERGVAGKYRKTCAESDAKTYSEDSMYNKAWGDPEWVENNFYDVVPVEVE